MTFATTTETALAALDRLTQATWIAADTETVARHDDGQLRDLSIDGPGAIRVLSLAGHFDTPEGPVVEAFVLDMGNLLDRPVAIDPATRAAFPDGDASSETGFACISRAAIAPRIAAMTWYMWNADFDEQVLDAAGIPAGTYQDLMLYQASLVLGASGVSFYDSLAAMASRYLGVNIDGKGTTQLSYTTAEPLDIDQVRYAAADAIATCDLVAVYERLVADADLGPAVALENGARPFRALMEHSGIPFDSDGWRGFLCDIQDKLDAAEANLATLSGGGQANLFDAVEKPTWKPASPDDVKRVLNTYAADSVRALLGGRLFEKADSVDNAALKMLDHPLATALIEWRDHAKTLSTYGEKFISFVRADGRVHARYLQNVVSTGRLSSSKPNMQNNAPEMKPFYRPPNRPLRDEAGAWKPLAGERVFVLGDLGQAELRYAAQVSKDPALIDAFIRGDDMHVVTAARMFQVDMEEIKQRDPKEYKVYRQRGKTMNFAVIYGLGPRALGQTLTLAGVPTTQDEAAELLRLYLAAFPKVAAWLGGRDEVIASLQHRPPQCNFDLTLRLHRLLPLLNRARKDLKKRLGRNATPAELVEEITPASELADDLSRRLGHEPDADELAAEITRRHEMVVWASTFKAAVVLTSDGSALEFSSRTEVGRRRIFNVTAEQWISSMLMTVATARSGQYAAIRSTFEKSVDATLSTPEGKTLSRMQLKKKFEDKDLKIKFLNAIFQSLGGGADKLCYAAVSDCIGGLGNAYRNAPIQGGVADAVLYAYQLLSERLSRFENAVPVQSVHDSIVLEVNVEEALEVAAVLKETMEEALAFFCPDVPAKADVDVAASLDADKDGISDDVLRHAFARVPQLV